MHENPAPSWWAFMGGLLVVIALLAVVAYRSEQGRLTQIRDECVAAATSESEKQACVTEYEVNSGWF